VARQTVKGAAVQLAANARQRAKKAGVPFDLSSTEIAAMLEPMLCQVTGLPLNFEQGPRNPFSPSLDRKVPSLGYVTENVQVVCWMYNAAKGTWTHEEVMKMATALTEKEGSFART